MVSCVGDDDVCCARVRTSPARSFYGGRESNVLLLGGILRGRARIADRSGAKILDSINTLLLMDCDCRARFETSPENYEFIYLSIPRDLAAEALGRREVFQSRSAVLQLPAMGVGSLLWSNLQNLVRHGEALTSQQCSVAMAGITELAIAVLQALARGRDDSGQVISLYAAATAYMARHAGRSNLTAERIAAALGCSRAQLYRAFRQNNDTVADHLRRIRLQKACALLSHAPKNRIGQIAFDCGYTDLAAFGKAFRRRYGVSPSEWRVNDEDE